MGKGYRIEESRLNQGLWSVLDREGQRIAACNRLEDAELITGSLNIAWSHDNQLELVAKDFEKCANPRAAKEFRKMKVLP
jgi:hypothetical protein